MSYQKEQEAFFKKWNLKVGSKIRLKPNLKSVGKIDKKWIDSYRFVDTTWQNSWVEEMDRVLGQVVTIESIDQYDTGFRIEECSYGYPYFLIDESYFEPPVVIEPIQISSSTFYTETIPNSFKAILYVAGYSPESVIGVLISVVDETITACAVKLADGRLLHGTATKHPNDLYVKEIGDLIAFTRAINSGVGK